MKKLLPLLPVLLVGCWLFGDSPEAKRDRSEIRVRTAQSADAAAKGDYVGATVGLGLLLVAAFRGAFKKRSRSNGG